MDNVIPITPETIPAIKKLSSDGGGGGMEERIAKLESDVEHIQTDMSDIKIDIREIRSDINKLSENTAQIPNLASKAELEKIAAQMLHFATKADVQANHTEIHAIKASLIQWIVGTMLASAGLAAAIAFGMAKLIK